VVHYRYGFHAGSPVVLVAGRVETRDRAAPSNIRFCQLARGDRHYPSYLGGEPLMRSEFSGTDTTRSLSGWVVMHNDADAIGVGAKSVDVDDTLGASSIYVDLGNANNAISHYRARLFFGPAGLSDEQYRDRLRDDRWHVHVVEPL